MRHSKWPSKSEETSIGGFDATQDLDTLFIPAEMPAKNGRNDDDHESIWYKDNRRKLALKALLELTATLLVQRWEEMGYYADVN